jgi:hypothetical protein
MEVRLMAIRKSSVSGVPSGTTGNRPSSPSVGQTYYNGTLGMFEIYTPNGWFPVNSPAGVPLINSATDVGTDRPYNNGAISLEFTPASTGGFPAYYSFVSNPATTTQTSSSGSPYVFTGLASNSSYTFVMSASNSYNTSSNSSSSASVTATTVPQAPTIGTPSLVTGTSYESSPQISVPFSGNATGGKSVTSYTVTSSPGGLTATGSSSPLVVSGLTAGTSYTFTATATNANGTSLSSSSSSAVTASTVPQAPSVTLVDNPTANSVRVSFSPNETGGSPITSYTVTSSPGGITATGSSSPITVSGLTALTSYTFTVTATNVSGTSSPSSPSSPISTSSDVYSLLQTYNSSSTFTVPSGITQIAVIARAPGTAGSSGNSSGGGAAGGRSGSAFGFKNYNVSSGQSFSVTVGSTTSFGSLGSASSSSNASSSVAGAIFVNGSSGGSANGGAGSGGGTINLSASGISSASVGGSGGGGGNGGTSSDSITVSGVTGGAAGSGGGAGGSGGSARGPIFSRVAKTTVCNHNRGNNGSAGSTLGGGGGGGGGGGQGSHGGIEGGTGTAGGTGGNGAAGQILVYGR